jgi:hypothetical protein
VASRINETIERPRPWLNGVGEFEMKPKNPNYLRDIIEHLECVHEAEKDFELKVRLGGLLNHAREVRDYAYKNGLN